MKMNYAKLTALLILSNMITSAIWMVVLLDHELIGLAKAFLMVVGMFGCIGFIFLIVANWNKQE